MKNHKVDICVIGAGSGGLSVAAGAVQMGASVALIESGEMGGDCLNYGCVPSKSLIAAAKRAHVFRTSDAFGIQSQEPKVDFKKVHKHIRDVIKAIEPNDSVERFEGLGVKVFRGKAAFRTPHEVQVGKDVIKSKYFIIATGSSPAIPPIPGVETTPYFTNETIFDLKEKPKHLVVVGGGPIGCELSQAFARLGVKVSLIEIHRILGREDPEVVEVLRKQIVKDGVELYENVQDLSFDKLTVKLKHKGKSLSLKGSHILLATGRRPTVSNLGLEKAGVTYSSRGINVDARLRTSKKHIFAIGDVIGGYQFTHMAAYHAQIVIKNCVFHLPSKVDYRAVPWVTYTDPEVAHVGISHLEAPPKCKTLVWTYKECDRAQAERETEGFIKVTTDKDGRVLGTTIIGANAGELILPWVMVIQKKKEIKALTDVIVPYPTLSEISKKVAGSYYTPLLFSPFTKKIVRFLMRIFT